MKRPLVAAPDGETALLSAHPRMNVCWLDRYWEFGYSLIMLPSCSNIDGAYTGPPVLVAIGQVSVVICPQSVAMGAAVELSAGTSYQQGAEKLLGSEH